MSISIPQSHYQIHFDASKANVLNYWLSGARQRIDFCEFSRQNWDDGEELVGLAPRTSWQQSAIPSLKEVSADVEDSD